MTGQNKYHIFGTFLQYFSGNVCQLFDTIARINHRDECRLKCTLRYLLVGLYSLNSYFLVDDGFFAMYRSLIIIAPYDFLNYTLSIKTGRLMLKLAKRLNGNYLSMVKQ